MDSSKDNVKVNLTTFNEDSSVDLDVKQIEYEVGIQVNEIFGTGVKSVTQTKFSNEDGGENEFTVTLTNGNTSRFTYYNGHRGSGEKGDKGDKGNGISKILFGNDNSMTVTLDNGDRYQSESLIGPQGLKGEKGDKGDTGAKGDKGEKGETGAVIVPTFQLDERGNLILYYDDPTK